ncbi:sensor histidine kinase [Staphylococcus canis]|uniref:histidine kinase n=1 Tax=Staphylococcus canis TaxID=2724942 RepID=A0ABS0T7V4_9STAP|nr:sensor histidine kinase [Staphylococcus canis]MBI5974829.1 sensor histidine kinase [Staphylococcus canis]
MTPYKPYRRQLRRSLYASTIFPVFLVLIIGLVSFYAVYIWIEHRTMHHHIHTSQMDIQHTTQQIDTFFEKERSIFEHLDLNDNQDITVVKRELLDFIHQQPVTLYYDLSNDQQSFTNNYEQFNTQHMYLLKHQRLSFKNGIYELNLYMAHTPLFKKMKKEERQFALIIDAYDNIVYTNDDRFNVGDKFERPQFGFLNEAVTLNNHQHQFIIYKDIHETLEDGMTLLLIMSIVLILLVLLGYVSANKMAQRQTEDIEAIIQKIDAAQHRKLGHYTPLKHHSELEAINHYIYDLFDSNEQLIKSIAHTEHRLRDIQLKEIERQFQPHFLFNTMQTIQYLIPLSPKAAQNVVQQLSQMLRYVLRTKSRTVTIAEELKYIQQYVAIQNIRFDDMIQLKIEASEKTLHYTIGKMMLQPLVENAIKHGRDEGTLHITIRLTPNRHNLFITVCDNGLGMSASRLQDVRASLYTDVFETAHLGLNHLHHRAMMQYGTQSRLHVFSKSQHGTLICYRIPISRRDEDV